MAIHTICFQVISIVAMIALFFMLKYSIDSYREQRDYSKTILGILGSFLSIIIMFSLVQFSLDTSSGCNIFILIIMIFLPSTVLVGYYCITFFDGFKEDNDKRRFIKKIVVVVIIVILTISSIYVIFEYTFTADANQRFLLRLEQDGSSEMELIIPNLESYDEYFDPDDYKVIEGKGQIIGYKGGEYLKIVTDSQTFVMKYSEESKPFSDYHEKWDFPFDKLKEDKDEEKMDIQYHSETNATCRLYLRWIDNYSPAFIGGHWHDVKADTTIDNETEEIVLEVDIAVV